MSEGIAALTKSMNADLLRLKTVSQNMANINTNGYKRSVVSGTSFQQILNSANAGTIGENQAGSVIAPTQTVVSDLTQGSLRVSNNQFDFAIDGEAFFEVNHAGQNYITRNGRLTLDSAGRLVLQQGGLIQGLSGDIHLEPGEFEVSDDGIIMQRGRVIDQLKLVAQPSLDELQYTGGGLFIAPVKTMGADLEKVRVLQGYSETSNVNMLDEMVRMIETTRHFEAASGVLQGYDSILDSAINTLGRF